MKTIEEVRAELETQKPRSAWSKGVTAYALDLLDDLEENINGGYVALPKTGSELKAVILNGATDWDQFSYGGSSLIYDEDIAKRLCCPSELKRCDGGTERPNAREEWLDVQARALQQAFRRLSSAFRFWEV